MSNIDNIFRNIFLVKIIKIDNIFRKIFHIKTIDKEDNKIYREIILKAISFYAAILAIGVIWFYSSGSGKQVSNVLGNVIKTYLPPLYFAELLAEASPSLIFFPIIILIFIFQPYWLSNIFKELKNENVIKNMQYAEHKPSAIKYALFYGVPLIITCAIDYFWIKIVTGSGDPNAMGFATKWFTFNYIYFGFYILFKVILPMYMVIIILIRQTLYSYITFKIFKLSEIKLQRDHKDQCNGFSPFGNLIKVAFRLIIVYGVGVNLIIFQPILGGGSPNFKWDTYIGLGIYFYAIVVFIIIPLFITNHFMSEKKEKMLNDIKTRILHLFDDFSNRSSTNTEKALQNIELLEKKYTLMNSLYYVWPIHMLNKQKKFFSSTTISIIISLIPFVTPIAKRLTTMF